MGGLAVRGVRCSREFCAGADFALGDGGGERGSALSLAEARVGGVQRVVRVADQACKARVLQRGLRACSRALASEEALKTHHVSCTLAKKDQATAG